MSDDTSKESGLFGPVTVEAKRAFSLKDLVSEFPDHPSDWTISEAYICLLLSAAMADGTVSGEESEEIRAIAHRSRTLKSLDENELAEANKVIVERRNNRPDWLAEACRALPREMRLSVFAHCLDITLADGALVSQEAEYLETIVELLEIAPEDAAMVTRVISIKNRY